MANINRVVIEGNLTRDPELRQLPSGNSVCKLRVAVNDRVKDRDSGQWSDRPNYFDVTVFGAKRQAVEIIAENTRFVGGREQAGEGRGGYAEDFAPVAARGPQPVAAADD